MIKNTLSDILRNMSRSLRKLNENLENQIVSGRISGMLTDEILLFE